MARKVYLRGGLGVGAFRRIYGGSKRNGSRPPHFCKSSGAVARHILQQLEKVNIVQVEGRLLQTGRGILIKLLDGLLLLPLDFQAD
ncbi:40S ribosomal protein S19-1 [Linum perenne]